MMFAFVAYQLWGTGIQTAQAQRSLSREFEEQVAETTAAYDDHDHHRSCCHRSADDRPDLYIDCPDDDDVRRCCAVAKPIPAAEEAVARLEIPRMDLNRIVVEGATAEALTKGPGHFPETPLPGQLGNAAIAGHRTTHLHPFFDIDKLQPGDEIIVTTLNGRYTYSVTGTEIVAPDDYASVIPTTDVTKATLTLVSCTPRYSATNRIVVRLGTGTGEVGSVDRGRAAGAGFGRPADSGTDTCPTRVRVTVVDTVVVTVAVPTTAPAAVVPDPTIRRPVTPSAQPVVRPDDDSRPMPSATVGSATRRQSRKRCVWGILLASRRSGASTC